MSAVETSKEDPEPSGVATVAAPLGNLFILAYFGAGLRRGAFALPAYAACFSTCTLSVASQLNSGSARPKWP